MKSLSAYCQHWQLLASIEICKNCYYLELMPNWHNVMYQTQSCQKWSYVYRILTNASRKYIKKYPLFSSEEEKGPGFSSSPMLNFLRYHYVLISRGCQ